MSSKLHLSLLSIGLFGANAGTFFDSDSKVLLPFRAETYPKDRVETYPQEITFTESVKKHALDVLQTIDDQTIALEIQKKYLEDQIDRIQAEFQAVREAELQAVREWKKRTANSDFQNMNFDGSVPSNEPGSYDKFDIAMTYLESDNHDLLRNDYEQDRKEGFVDSEIDRVLVRMSQQNQPQYQPQYVENVLSAV
eukprot:335368_1